MGGERDPRSQQRRKPNTAGKPGSHGGCRSVQETMNDAFPRQLENQQTTHHKAPARSPSTCSGHRQSVVTWWASRHLLVLEHVRPGFPAATHGPHPVTRRSVDIHRGRRCFRGLSGLLQKLKHDLPCSRKSATESQPRSKVNFHGAGRRERTRQGAAGTGSTS